MDFWGEVGPWGIILSTTLRILTQVSQFSPIWKSFQWSFGGWGDDYGEWKKEAPQILFSLEQDVSIRCSASQVTVVSGNKKRDSIPPWLIKISPAQWMGEAHAEMVGKSRCHYFPPLCLGSFHVRLKSSFPLAQQQVVPSRSRGNTWLSLLSMTCKRAIWEENILIFSESLYCGKTDVMAVKLGQRH